MIIESPNQSATIRAAARKTLVNDTAKVFVGAATCGIATGASKLVEAMREHVASR